MKGIFMFGISGEAPLYGGEVYSSWPEFEQESDAHMERDRKKVIRFDSDSLFNRVTYDTLRKEVIRS